MKFDPELQKAVARYATAKTIETYVHVALLVGAIAAIGVLGYQAMQAIQKMFGM